MSVDTSVPKLNAQHCQLNRDWTVLEDKQRTFARKHIYTHITGSIIFFLPLISKNTRLSLCSESKLQFFQDIIRSNVLWLISNHKLFIICNLRIWKRKLGLVESSNSHLNQLMLSCDDLLQEDLLPTVNYSKRTTLNQEMSICER